MPSPISVKIEMPVYLKKYLIGQSMNKQEPLEFSTEHDYSLLLVKLASNRTAERIKQDENTVKIRLPFNRGKDVYFYNNIGFNRRVFFREQVRLDFYYEFRTYLKKRIMEGIERKIAIEEFFERYKITEDDVKYESFYRNFTRFNDKLIRKANNNATTQPHREMCQV